jgi:hypothetical protein
MHAHRPLCPKSTIARPGGASAFPCLLAAFLAHGLSAQATVSPTHFTLAEGNGFDQNGLGAIAGTCRYLQVHDDLKVPRLINALSLRRDAVSNPNSGLPAFSVTADIECSTAAPGRTSTTLWSTFDVNHGAGKTRVAFNKQFSFPATAAGPIPRPFEFVMMFQQPFAFAGTNGLCWELKVFSRSNQSLVSFDDARSADSNPAPVFRHTGSGCRTAPHSSPMSLRASSGANWPAGQIAFGYQGVNLPLSGMVLLAFGVASTSWSVPNTASAPSGQCTIYNDWWVTMPVATDPIGSFALSLPLPTAVTPNGGSLFAQVVALDANANPWGVVMSNGVQHHVVAPFPTVPIGSLFVASLGTDGAIRPSRGQVVKFE